MIRMVPPHPSSLLQQAHALRHAGSLCDVVFSLEGRAFRAHRLVLAWSSPALAPRLLQEALDRPLRCTLDICSPHTFQQVLDYSYGQVLALAPGELGPLRSAAGLLGMRHLEEQCRGLQESLDPRAMDLTPPAPEDMEEWRAEVPPAPEETAPRRLSLGKETKEEDEEEEVETSRPPASPPPPSERSPSEKRVLASSTLPYTRDSVIRASSPRPPWASVSPLHPLTLRCVAQQYSSLVALRSLHHSQGHYHGPPAPRASSPGQADCAQAQLRRLSAAPPGLEDQVGPDLRARFSVTHSSETRYMRRILHAPHVLVDRQRSEKCSPSSGMTSEGCTTAQYRVKPASTLLSPVHAHPRSEPSAGGGGGRLSPGAKPYACLQCPKRFSLKHQLETHHRVHTGEKPFECRLCGQRSRDYSAMIKHLRTHGGAGPYRCTACRDFCSSLAAMQKHVEQHAARDFPPDWSIRRTYLYTSHV